MDNDTTHPSRTHRMPGRRLALALAVPALVLAAVAEPAAAAPQPYAFAYTPFFMPPLPLLAPPPFGPTLLLGPYAINQVTVLPVLPGALYAGAGACMDPPAVGRGIACLDIPAWNPVAGAPTVFFQCEVTAALGPWGFPALHFAQDLDANGVIGPGDIVADPIPTFGGPLVGGTVFSAGLFPFGPGPFVPGLPVVAVAVEGFGAINLTPMLLSMSITCTVL